METAGSSETLLGLPVYQSTRRHIRKTNLAPETCWNDVTLQFCMTVGHKLSLHCLYYPDQQILSLSLSLSHTHTHTHTYIYIYIVSTPTCFNASASASGSLNRVLAKVTK